jgi:hypothetical protein
MAQGSLAYIDELLVCIEESIATSTVAERISGVPIRLSVIDGADLKCGKVRISASLLVLMNRFGESLHISHTGLLSRDFNRALLPVIASEQKL